MSAGADAGPGLGTRGFMRMRAGALNIWKRDERGIAAVEFALLGIPFMMFIIGIIELAMYFTSSVLLQGAVSDASRMIRTGQAQTSGDPQAVFSEALCDHANMLLDCGEIQFHVEVVDSFATADTVPEFDESGELVDKSFDAGGVSDIVLVQVSYLYPLMTPLIGQFFADQPDFKRLILATAVFQTEPYDFE